MISDMNNNNIFAAFCSAYKSLNGQEICKSTINQLSTNASRGCDAMNLLSCQIRDVFMTDSTLKHM